MNPKAKRIGIIPKITDTAHFQAVNETSKDSCQCAVSQCDVSAGLLTHLGQTFGIVITFTRRVDWVICQKRFGFA